MSVEVMTLKVMSPLALHRRRASEQFAPTLDYIPGSAVRGALADAYLAGNPERACDADFEALFLSDTVRFSDFFPVPGHGKGLTRLLPATAVACKRFRGHEAGSMSDSLLRLELAREMDGTEPLEIHGWGKCLVCLAEGRQEKRDRAQPAYYRTPEAFERVSTRTRLMAGASIERATGTAAHAMLFSHEVIEEGDGAEGVCFRGTVDLPGSLRGTLHRLASYGQRLAVGYGRTRGLGQVMVEPWDAPPAERQPLPQRWEALNEAARDLWQACGGRRPQGPYFSLTLQSHLALRNAAGEPVLGDVAAADIGLPPEAVRCRSVMSAVAVPGWNAAQNLPKTDTWALARGSVLLFRLPPETDIAPTLAVLERLEAQGVGDRRAEGFGRVIACDAFHSYFLQRETKGGSR